MCQVVVVFKASMLNCRGQSAMGIYLHCAIYETYLVSWLCRDLCLIGGGGNLCGVMASQISMLDWRGINLP